ncbi:hypothetical protein XELAEV_18032932mg [Xenopus laevis]|uniref:GIY-YIG domain-containing protein n=1 Tax=Xenopus laevis TaxID=8355 RepID=A0A974CJV4_XENLA|nr:hypothetical protein XELAEV_18032932mg [Xenopus laevis]
MVIRGSKILSCNCCSNCQKGDIVYHPRKGDPIKIREYYTCTSTFVVYIVKCPCGYLYVGQTTRMIRDRIREHKSAIRLKKTDQAVASHFVEKDHGVQQLRFQVIDNVPKLQRGGDRNKELLIKEAWWIRCLETMEPHGLNREYDLHSIFR